MSGVTPVLKPKTAQPQFDIFHGADVNDIGEIAGALQEDPNVLNAQEPLTGKTAATIAAADGNLLALHFLIVTHKADPWIKDKHGQLALDYARAIGHHGCRQVLLKAMFPELDGDGDGDGYSPDVVRLVPR